jgi:hypothetical protein
MTSEPPQDGDPVPEASALLRLPKPPPDFVPDCPECEEREEESRREFEIYKAVRTEGKDYM